MRMLIALCAILAWTPVRATHLDYLSGRNWVEKQCLTNAIPQDERMFLGRWTAPAFAAIHHFRKGITLRQLIDQTPLRGKTVYVRVMRLDHLKTGPFTRYKSIKVGPSEDPDYELKALDVLWFFDEAILIEI